MTITLRVAGRNTPTLPAFCLLVHSTLWYSVDGIPKWCFRDLLPHVLHDACNPFSRSGAHVHKQVGIDQGAREHIPTAPRLTHLCPVPVLSSVDSYAGPLGVQPRHNRGQRPHQPSVDNKPSLFMSVPLSL